MSLALETEGHAVVAAESSSGAWRQMQKSTFDLAFLDLRLGQEDGLEVLDKLRLADASLTVVLITTHSQLGRLCFQPIETIYKEFSPFTVWPSFVSLVAAPVSWGPRPSVCGARNPAVVESLAIHWSSFFDPNGLHLLNHFN